jgi:hypothetical protein
MGSLRVCVDRELFEAVVRGEELDALEDTLRKADLRWGTGIPAMAAKARLGARPLAGLSCAQETWAPGHLKGGGAVCSDPRRQARVCHPVQVRSG